MLIGLIKEPLLNYDPVEAISLVTFSASLIATHALNCNHYTSHLKCIIPGVGDYSLYVKFK